MHFCNQVLYIFVILLSLALQTSSVPVPGDETCAEKEAPRIVKGLATCVKNFSSPSGREFCVNFWGGQQKQAAIKCGYIPSFTLCRVSTSGRCTTINQGTDLTEDVCKKLASEDLKWHGADGSTIVYSAKHSHCMGANFNCLNYFC